MSVSTGFSASHRPTPAEFRKHVYAATGWVDLKRWNGRDASMVDAGIAGPSVETDSWQPAPTTAAGSSTDVGTHWFRYRYLDSSTGWVSNPSEARAIAVAAGALALTFPIAAVGGAVANMLRTADAKVDKIVLEATVVNGTNYFKIGEASQTAASLTVDMSDATLQQLYLPWPEDGHDVPPVAKYVLSHRERLWLYGQVSHSTGTCSVTLASANVVEGTTDPDWDADALGDSTATPATYPDVQWFFQRDGDAAIYEISTYDVSNTLIMLKTAYTGVTGANVGYRIFTRANPVWISRAGYPEAFIPDKFLTGPNGEGVGDVTAGLGYGPGMLFFSLTSIFQLNWDQDPLVDPVYTPVSHKRGALSQRVVVEAEGVVYTMDRAGWYAWSGVSPRHLSRPMDDFLDDLDFAYVETWHACYYPRLRAIRWFVTESGDTLPKTYVQYDVDSGTWGTGALEVAIEESRLIPTATGPKVYLGDENGHTWIDDTGPCEGCAAAMTHLVVGSHTTPTTTVIPITGTTLHTTNVGLDGCMAHHLESGESRLITANAADSITCAAFTAAPSVGDTIWVGRILAKLKTKAFQASAGARKKRRGRYLWLYFEPHASTRHLLVRFYLDYSSTAETYPSASRSLPGLTYPGNNADYAESNGTYSDWLVTLSHSQGMVQIPIPSKWHRACEVEFEWIEPDCRTEVYGIEIGGEDVEGMA